MIYIRKRSIPFSDYYNFIHRLVPSSTIYNLLANASKHSLIRYAHSFVIQIYQSQAHQQNK